MPINNPYFDQNNAMKIAISRTNDDRIRQYVDVEIIEGITNHIRNKVSNGDAFYTTFGINMHNYTIMEPMVIELIQSVIDLAHVKNSSKLLVELPITRMKMPVSELVVKLDIASFLN